MRKQPLCYKLKGRVKVYATVYRKFHDGPSRVWITLDKEELISGADVSYMVKHNRLYEEIKNEPALKGLPYHQGFDQRLELRKVSASADQILINEGVFESNHFFEPAMKYHTLTMEEALMSENIITKAFCMFDRRLG